MANRKDVELNLLKILSTIGMDKPSNFDEILDFVKEDFETCADPVDWSESDVVIGLRRFIEQKETI